MILVTAVNTLPAILFRVLKKNQKNKTTSTQRNRGNLNQKALDFFLHTQPTKTKKQKYEDEFIKTKKKKPWTCKRSSSTAETSFVFSSFIFPAVFLNRREASSNFFLFHFYISLFFQYKFFPVVVFQKP